MFIKGAALFVAWIIVAVAGCYVFRKHIWFEDC